LVAIFDTILLQALPKPPESSVKSSRLPSDSEVRAEIANGCDGLVEDLRRHFDQNMDKFEMYCMRNIFDVPPTLLLEDDNGGMVVEGLGSGSGAGAGESKEAGSEGAADEAATDAALAELRDQIVAEHQAILQERRKRRTLKHVRRLYRKRLPQFEDASDSIRKATEGFCGTGPHGAAQEVEGVV